MVPESEKYLGGDFILSSSPSAKTTLRCSAAARERRSATNPTLGGRLGAVLFAQCGGDGGVHQTAELLPCSRTVRQRWS